MINKLIRKTSFPQLLIFNMLTHSYIGNILRLRYTKILLPTSFYLTKLNETKLIRPINYNKIALTIGKQFTHWRK